MSWREQLTDRGQFRGIAFFVRSHTQDGGRRNIKNEFPFRDLPAVQDLGRKAHTYSLDLYVIGADYMPARDALRNALDEAGTGELQHPWLGILRVNVDTWRLEESTDRGGIARFTVSFIESGEVKQPVATIDTAVEVQIAAQNLRVAAMAVLSAQHLPAKMPDWSLAKLQQSVRNLAQSLPGNWEAVLNNVRSTVDLAESIYWQATATMLRARTGFGLRELLDRVRKVGALIVGRSDGTPDGDQLARSQDVVGQVVRISMIAAAAASSATIKPISTTKSRAASSVSSSAPAASSASSGARTAQAGVQAGSRLIQSRSKTEAQQMRQSIHAMIEAEIERLSIDGASMPAPLYYALIDLRAAVTRDVAVLGLLLPHTVSWTPAATLPAVVIAHRLYGDALRDADIVSSNAIRHPGFVPGGVALEVLSE